MRRVWAHRPQFLYLALFFAAYVLGCGFAQALAIVPGITVSIWPPGGVFMATLILTSPYSWPWWVLAGCLAEMFAQLVWFHSPLPAGFLIYVGNALCAAVGATLLNWTCGRPVRLETLREVLAFVVLGAGVAPLASATVGSATLAWFGVKSQTFTAVWPLFWIGDATGILLVAPLSLVVIEHWRSKTKLSAAQWTEAGVLGLIFLGIAALSLTENFLPSAYIIMPPLLWAAVRFEFKGVAVALTILALITMALTMSGASQFVGDPESQRQKQVILQLFLAISAFSALIVAAISRQHQQALLTLRDRERELSQLVNMVPSHLWRLMPDGEPVFFNRRMVDFLGLDVADTDNPGMSRLDAMVATVIHPDDAEEFKDILSRCVATGENFALRYRLRRADGAYRWMSSRAEPMRDESGRILQWYGLCQDIDDQMHAEEALRRSERRLQQMIDTVPTLIWCTTRDGTPTYINKRLMDTVGVTLEELTAPDASRSLADVHPDDRCAMGQALAHSFETGNPFAMKYRQRRSDGTYRWTDGRAEPLRDESGGIVQWYGVCVDIEDMMTAQGALRSRERELSLLVDMVPNHVWRLTPDGEPSFYNKRLIDFLGLDVVDIEKPGMSRLTSAIAHLVHPDDAAGLKEALNRSFATGEPFAMRYRMRRADGVYRWLESRAEPLRDDSGVLMQWYGANLDVHDLVTAQEALHDREREFSQLVNMVPIPIWRLTPDGTPTFFNKRLIDFFGLDVADYEKPGMSRLAATIESVVHPDDAARVAEALNHSFATGQSYVLKYRLRRADGVYRWVEGRAEPMRDEGGRILQWYGLVNDIDDQLRADEAMRGLANTAIALNSCQSLDEVMRTITDRARAIIGAHMAIIGTTVDQKHAQAIQAVSLSQKYAAYQDFDAQPDGSGIYTLVCDLNRPMRLTQAQLEAHPAWRGFGKHADQHPRLRGWLAVPLIDSNGRNMGLLQLSDKDQGEFTAEDEGIAVQLARMASLAIAGARLHESLANSERSLRQLVETLPAMIDCAAPDGEPIYRSQQLREFLGYNLEDLDGAGKSRLDGTLDTGVHPDDLAGVKKQYAHSLATGEPYARKHRLRRFDGEYRWVETRAAAMRNAEGAIVQWNVICLDIDSEVRAQEKLRMAQESLARASQAASLAELSASIAHEVNQPLAAIVANSHACHRWLSAEPANVERAKITAERIIRDANSAADVVSRIRALFKQSAARNSIALGSVIAEARDLMAEEAVRHRVRMDIDVESNLPLVALDRVEIQQVLINLMRNGMEAMEAIAGPRVLGVRVRRMGDVVQTEISDRGRGIEFPDKIFEPFFTTKNDGMGMGLAICRSIVEAHGGRLWAESNEPHGATFCFTLPVEAKATA